MRRRDKWNVQSVWKERARWCSSAVTLLARNAPNRSGSATSAGSPLQRKSRFSFDGIRWGLESDVGVSSVKIQWSNLSCVQEYRQMHSDGDDDGGGHDDGDDGDDWWNNSLGRIWSVTRKSSFFCNDYKPEISTFWWPLSWDAVSGSIRRRMIRLRVECYASQRKVSITFQ